MSFSRTATFVALALFVLGVSSYETVRAQESAQALLPLPPKNLLAVLPAAPPEWKLTASNAKHLPRNRPLSRAHREYTFTPPPGNPVPTPPATSTAKITIVDTAGNPDLANFLTSPETASAPGRLTIESMPARHVKGSGTSDQLDVLALQRFLITISLEGGNKDKPEDWLKRIDLQALRRSASQNSYFDPKKEYVLIAESVDEFDPKRTRSSKWAIGAEKDENDTSQSK